MPPWLLLLLFDFEDDAPGCIDLERRWLLCDELTVSNTVVLYRANNRSFTYLILFTICLILLKVIR